MADQDLTALGLVADLRKALGDPLGKLMQDELIEHAAALVAERDRLRAQVEDMRAAVHSCHPGCSNARCVAERLRADVAELVRVLDRVAGEGPRTLAQLDAAHGTARALIAKHNARGKRAEADRPKAA